MNGFELQIGHNGMAVSSTGLRGLLLPGSTGRVPEPRYYHSGETFGPLPQIIILENIDEDVSSLRRIQ